MKRIASFLAPPIAFGLAWFAAWLMAAPGPVAATARTALHPPLTRARLPVPKFANPAEAVAWYEARIALNPALPRGEFSAQGMREALELGRDQASTYARQWAAESPQEMAGWLNRGEAESALSREFTEILFETWVRKDTQAALAAADSMTLPPVKRQALLSSLCVASERDATRARELLVANLDLFARSDTTAQLVLPFDEKAALSGLLLSLPEGSARTGLLARYLQFRWNTLRDDRGGSSAKVWLASSPQQQRELIAAGFSPSPDLAPWFPGWEDRARETAADRKPARR